MWMLKTLRSTRDRVALNRRSAKSRRQLNFERVNTEISGAKCQEQKMRTGDSPLASNALGELADCALLQATGKV